MIPLGHIVKAEDGTMGIVVERPKRGPEATAKILESDAWVYVQWQSKWVERVLASTVREVEYAK